MLASIVMLPAPPFYLADEDYDLNFATAEQKEHAAEAAVVDYYSAVAVVEPFLTTSSKN